jgi:hypothetical protein
MKTKRKPCGFASCTNSVVRIGDVDALYCRAHVILDALIQADGLIRVAWKQMQNLIGDDKRGKGGHAD